MADSLANSRAKRQKTDKHGRLSALEKLKQLKGKGNKHKYDVDVVDNVYDTVDEREYSERVLQRQEDDWIEDDDGTGYVEDGREIFDDDEGEYEATISNETGRGQKRKAKVAAQPSAKGNIRNLLGAMPTKKKEDVKISDDNILSDIMSDLDGNASSAALKPKPVMQSKNIVESSKKDAQNYFKSLSSSVKKPTVTLNNKTPSFKEEKVVLNGDKSHDPTIPKQEIPKETGEEHKASTSKTAKKIAWQIDREIKRELEDSATQNIEEFNTQDFNFDDDFSNDALPLPITPKTVKKEESSNAITDVAEEFLNDDFEIFPTKKSSPKELAPLTSTWTDLMGENETAVTVQTDGQLPLTTNEDGEKVLKFYWLDAWEDRFVKPGVVYLFGKVFVNPAKKKAGCVSCCLVVRNVNRQMFLLPREYKLDPVTLEPTDHEVTMMDMYEEFNTSVASELGLKEFKSRKVTKNYCFNLPDIPAQSDYLEVKYSASLPPPPANKKHLTFSHIFGTNTSSLETFLLERKIKGPCWLEIKQAEAVQAKVSWCKLEASCEKMEHVTVIRSDGDLDPPPVVIAAINMRTTMDPKTRKTKIIMLSCLTHSTFPIHKPPPNPPFQQHFCVMSKCNEIWPLDLKQALPQYKATKLTKCDTERELLNYFMVQFWKLDPDLVVGHDLQGFQQDLLIGNILDMNIPNWSRLGRLKRSVVPQRKFAAKDAFLGRLVCDIKLSAMELIRARSFDLETLCVNVLKMKEGERVDVALEDLPRYYENSRDLFQLVSLSMQDASYILKIMCELNVIPLAKQITQIAGNVMSRTLMGGRSERNEFLLLHAFTEKNYIVPDKMYGRRAAAVNEGTGDDAEDGTATDVSKKQGKKKAAYSGGLVLDPKKGFYDKLILLMDFNSLYPSIIQEYNICFTTIKRKSSSATDDDVANLVLPNSNTELGVLPTQIRKLVESRREVKKLMKTPDLSQEQYMQYNIRQMGLKLTANSMYGCLGFTHSRFYAKPLAALVTMKGREILMDTKEIVQKSNYDVVYGDTDSLMINTNCLDYDNVFKIGVDIKREINKKYKQIELDIDGVFRYLLLLKKKKYAAVLISKNKNGEFTFTQEHKGLDIVRRDWSQLAAEAGKFILSQILSEQSADERLESIQAHLNKLKEDLMIGKMPLSMLTITKQLTKNPNEYADKNSQPHVQVALRLNIKNSRRFKKGDIVPYIICEDGTANSATQRAYHIEELKNSEHLKVDFKYYLAHQLHPVISRICDPIEGMDPSRVADCLGLDPSGYRQIKRETGNTETYEVENEQEKYRQCKEFTFVCVNENCKTENRIRETCIKLDKESVTFLERCQNDKCAVRPVDYIASVQNQLSLQIRQYHVLYYAGWVSCEDPACGHRTTRLPQTFAGGYPLCRLCEKGVMFREYTEKDLYLQINFFMFLFDLGKGNNTKARVSTQITAAFQVLKEMVEDALAHSAYSIINISKLFRFFTIDPKASKVKNEPVEIDILPETEQIDALLEMGIY